jgi:hypothetical protein
MSRISLLMIEKYPAALQHRNKSGYFAIQIECDYRCRSPIVSKCVELYPDSLKMADEKGNLPLHLLLGKLVSTVDDALMMIKKYPAALEHRDNEGNLPLHNECKLKCRTFIISKCIELYPKSLSIANRQGHLPLHKMFANKSATIDDTLMMIEKYPTALRHRIALGDDANLPLHMEFINRSRPPIIAKLIELYPEALDDRAIAIIVNKVDRGNIRKYASVLATIFTARPMLLYEQDTIPAIHFHNITKDAYGLRRILNVLPRHVFTPIHESDYRDLNWRPRAAMVRLLSQIQQRSKLQLGTLAESNIMKDSDSISSSITKWFQQQRLLLRLIKASTLLSSLDVDKEGRAVRNDASYSICQHEDLGDILLRSVIAFL